MAEHWFRKSSLPPGAEMAHEGWAIDVLDVLARPREETNGSSPWSKSRLDLIQMLAPVVGAHRVERAGLIQARKKFIRQRGHERVGLFRNAHRQLG